MEWIGHMTHATWDFYVMVDWNAMRIDNFLCIVDFRSKIGSLLFNSFHTVNNFYHFFSIFICHPLYQLQNLIYEKIELYSPKNIDMNFPACMYASPSTIDKFWLCKVHYVYYKHNWNRAWYKFSESQSRCCLYDEKGRLRCQNLMQNCLLAYIS